jgi:hypothetical protein
MKAEDFESCYSGYIYLLASRSCAITGESVLTSSDNHRMPTRLLNAIRMISTAFAQFKLQ